MSSERLTFDEGWRVVETEAIDRIKVALESDGRARTSAGRPRRLFTYSEIINMKTTVYNLCTNKHAEYGNCSAEVYRRYGEIYNTFCLNVSLPALRDAKGKGSIPLLDEFVRRWADHEVLTFWLEKFFLYLEQWYTKHAFVPKLRQVSIQKFKDLVYDEVKKDVTAILIGLVGEDRNGTAVDRTLMKKSVEIYEIVGIDSLDAYTKDLEKPLLVSTRQYYSNLKQTWMASFSITDFLEKADRTLTEEESRLSDYLNEGSSASKMLEIFREEILEPVRCTFFAGTGSAIRELLVRGQRTDLRRLFRLYSEIGDCLESLTTSFRDFTLYRGQNLTGERQLLLFYNECLAFVEESFGRQPIFLRTFIDYYLCRSLNNDSARHIGEFLGPSPNQV